MALYREEEAKQRQAGALGGPSTNFGSGGKKRPRGEAAVAGHGQVDANGFESTVAGGGFNPETDS